MLPLWYGKVWYCCGKLWYRIIVYGMVRYGDTGGAKEPDGALSVKSPATTRPQHIEPDMFGKKLMARQTFQRVGKFSPVVRSSLVFML